MIREWNLFFDRGDLIRREDVESMEIVPLKYPAELENSCAGRQLFPIEKKS